MAKRRPDQEPNLLTIASASKRASKLAGRNVTTSNISYLVNYGRIKKFVNEKGETCVDIRELDNYQSWRKDREKRFKRRFGEDLNWNLSFEEYKEAETTKHVHRLHPYKGKFIPQLVEYFLDSHTDEFKAEAAFKPGDVVLDPFCGSGTLLVQANELGMHAIGVDISQFNAMIANLKLCRLSADEIAKAAEKVEQTIREVDLGAGARAFEADLLADIKKFNDKHFPSPEYRRRVRSGEIDEKGYGAAKAKEFLPTYDRRLKQHKLSGIKPKFAGGGGIFRQMVFCDFSERN